MIRVDNNSNKSNKNNIKQKKKIFIKNNISNIIRINNENINQNNNSINFLNTQKKTINF